MGGISIQLGLTDQLVGGFVELYGDVFQTTSLSFY